jgi:hypothetical protein
MLRPWLFEESSIEVHWCMLVVRQISPPVHSTLHLQVKAQKKAGEKKPSQIGSAW